ncbi:HAD hydrolase-like protein [Candidatus Woesearchaeota archaeon]|nr:HAD hydrolase-like protein [Candidatus Woesearchaeota archaeon]
MIKGIIFDFNRTLYDKEHNQFFPEAKPLLRELKGAYKLSLISKAPDNSDAIYKDYEFISFFEKIVIKPEKTEKEFQECLTAMKLGTAEVIIVGDKIKGEISIGNKLGIITVWFRQGKYAQELPSSPREKPTFIINALPQLPVLLYELKTR